MDSKEEEESMKRILKEVEDIQKSGQKIEKVIGDTKKKSLGIWLYQYGISTTFEIYKVKCLQTAFELGISEALLPLAEYSASLNNFKDSLLKFQAYLESKKNSSDFVSLLDSIKEVCKFSIKSTNEESEKDKILEDLVLILPEDLKGDLCYEISEMLQFNGDYDLCKKYALRDLTYSKIPKARTFFKIGYIYEVIFQDEENAIEWYTKGWDCCQCSDCANNLGNIFQTSKDPNIKDIKKALLFYNNAAQKNNFNAFCSLFITFCGNLEENKDLANKEKADFFFKKIIENGKLEDVLNFADSLSNEDISRDQKEGIFLDFDLAFNLLEDFTKFSFNNGGCSEEEQNKLGQAQCLIKKRKMLSFFHNNLLSPTINFFDTKTIIL